MKKPSGTVFHDVLLGSVAKIMQSGGRLLLAAMLARFLGAEQFGLFITIQWIVDFSFMVCCLGANSVAPRFFPGLSASNGAAFARLDRWYAKSVIAASLVTAIAASAATALWFTSLETDIIAWVAVWAVVNSASTLLLSRAQGLLRFRLFAAWSVGSLAIVLAIVLLRSSSLTVIDTIQCFVLGGAVCLGLHLVWGYRHVPDVSQSADVASQPSPTRKHVVQYALNSWIASTLSALVWSRAELAVLGHMVTLADIGQYAAALTLVGLVAQSFGILMTGLGPRLTLWWNLNDRRRAHDACIETSLVMLFISALFGVFACFYGDILLATIFGAGYAGAHVALAVLAIGTVGLTCACASQILQNQTNGKFGRDLNILASVVFIPMTAGLILMFGPIGAALSRAVVQMGSGVATFIRLARLEDMRTASLSIIGRMAAVTAILVTCLVGTEWWGVPDLGLLSMRRAAVFLAALGAVTLVTCLGSNGLSWAGARKVFER